MDSADFILASPDMRHGVGGSGFQNGRRASNPMKGSQQTSPALSDAPVSNACIVCHKPIADGQWFCRLPQDRNRRADSRNGKISLCSPSCAYRYFAFSDIGASQI
jgi:hypothetical protein